MSIFDGKKEKYYLNNYKITIQYDGSCYAGWQTQAQQNTVQQKLSESIEIILKEKINLIGSGRTDTGVHALGQVANFRTSGTLDANKFLYSLNSILPYDISVLNMEKVSENFHSRFDAKIRNYLYLITKHKSALFYKYSYFYHYPIDCLRLNELSRSILGKKDFTSFSKKKSDTENKICEVYQARWKETNGFVMFYISADRYLHGMVRTIVGTLLYTLKKELNNEYIENIFEQRNREAASESAPANGLFLFKVKY